MGNNTNMTATDLGLYSGKPEGSSAPTIADLHNARTRWGSMAMSGILGCAADKNVGMKKFLEVADTTQRELVGAVAKEFYCGELGLTEDTLETFLTVTNLGITGCGFDQEILVEDTDTRCVIEARTCPIVDHANMAGIENGSPEMENLSLWCDTYDNFESAAVSPSQVLVHSHCLGKGDKNCRIICKTLDDKDARKEGEHIFDYTGRLRNEEKAAKPDGPWAMDDKPSELVEDMIRDLVSGSVQVQTQIAPTLYDRKKMGAEIWGRIGAASTVMAGKLRGWDTLIAAVKGNEGKYLQKPAQAKVEELSLNNGSVDDVEDLHLALLKGQDFGDVKTNKESSNCIKGSCSACPIVQWSTESELGDDLGEVMNWCSAARTQEAQVIASDITQTYTHCLGRGDDACRWVIEKN